MISDIVDNYNAMRTSIITISDCTESLLTSSVPLLIKEKNTKTSLHFYPLTSIYFTFYLLEQN